MTKEYSLEVKNEKGRLDKFVSEQIPDLSRTRVKELVKDQNILVNGKVEKVSQGTCSCNSQAKKNVT